MEAVCAAGIRPGLERMHRLLDRLGHPERDLNFIHIAGTNGKGSTAAALDSILRAAGFTPGLYTSPHLVDFRERFRVGGEPVDSLRLERELKSLLRIIRQIPFARRPTFFEAATALALKIFHSAGVDFVVWETGLGGRLDATNVVSPELCLLTSLGRDHEEILGHGYGNLGREKAGILKRGVPVFSAPWPAAARQVLGRRARALRCPWKIVRPLGPKSFSLAGDHQRQNAALAAAAARYLSFPEVIIRRGLNRTRWPARFMTLRNKPPLVLDGAHNPQGIEAALRTWESVHGGRPERVIFGCLKDKAMQPMLRTIRQSGGQLWGVALPGSRGSDPLTWPVSPDRFFASPEDAMEEEKKCPRTSLVLGSLVLAGEVLRHRGVKVV
ncbi:bifunctional folylpolyglutamate synthase/dihydrofolate synthase [bacterium]|nr:bifunctional folylpolyglutamate synthase/dihydrofolate synthase [bacterium]